MKSLILISNETLISTCFYFLWKEIQRQCLYWNRHVCFYFYFYQFYYFVVLICCFFLESSGVLVCTSTSSAFISSLYNKESLGAFKSLVTSPMTAICRYSDFGPTCGGGHDVYIANNANSTQNSYTHFDNSYPVPSGVQDHYTILAGTSRFTPDDWEVFYLA